MAKTIKLVRYNGKCESIYGSSPPNKLKMGEVYKVVDFQTFGKHLEYELDGIAGAFNSAWFDEVHHITVAVSKGIPAAGTFLVCYAVSLSSPQPTIEEMKILVKEVHLYELNSYQVTDFSEKHYIIQVLA